ncbi:MAG: UDP-N-acetylmuramoyl-tripeptide--D-alanyl-D-alanine ligase [Synechococcaceae cyanobacterium]|nr:UDP-N-acetylmuramoyl-tripeptide--D-alanyl-D-alanine ligase [Synechococcaceae cyanobacterium]
MSLQPDQLVDLWGEPIAIDQAWRHQPIAAVGTDSRQDLSHRLYVPLVGERFDGHDFLREAFAAGAVGAAVQRDRLDPAALDRLSAEVGRPLWPVDDTMLAYQQIGRLWRRRRSIPVVAITGSAGKTTTRELVRAALSPLGPVVASSGNENNDIGVPLTLLRSDDSSAALVVEMGMRGLGEIERLSLCAEPDLAVITNIGTAHIGRLGSREAIATAKCEIVRGLATVGTLVIPAGDPLLEAALAGVWTGRVRRVALADEEPVHPAGLPPADLVGQLEPDSVAGSGVGVAAGAPLRIPGWPTLRLPLAGRHNARNLLLALAVAEELGVPKEALTGLETDLPGGRNRRQQLGALTLLDETYNASPEAVLAALDLLAAQAASGRRYAVLGTMLELGERSLELHGQVAERARDLGLDGLVIVASGAEGEAMEAAAAGLPRLARVNQPEQALEPLSAWLTPGDVVLLKASRGVALERLIPLLPNL